MLGVARRTWPRRIIVLALALLVAFLFCSTPRDAAVLSTRINQLSVEVERRVQWWDWKDTPEEIFCRAHHDLKGTKDPIPNIVHFVHLSAKGKRTELSYYQFLALKAAVLRMNAEVRLHTYDFDTENRWWQQIRGHVTHVVHGRDELRGPHGLDVSSWWLPHQADLMRIAILRQEGGIYMDTDAYALKPFTDLLSNPRDTIMGHEGGNRYGLCNAVIVSRANSEFLRKWEESYKTFNPGKWNEHSVRKPKLLQVRHPDLVCPLSPTAFFWPTWAKKHLHYMHDPITPEETAELRANMSSFGGAMYENQLAFHAGGTRDWLQGFTLDYILKKDTRFNVLIRDIAAAPL